MYDILTKSILENKVKIVGSEIEAFRSKEISKKGARLFGEGKILSAAHIGEISDQLLLERCRAHSELALPSEGTPHSQETKRWNLSKIQRKGSEIALKAAEEQLQFLKGNLPNFSFQGQVAVSQKTDSYTNDLGANLYLDHDEYTFSYDMRRIGSPNIADAFFYFENCSGFFSKEALAWTIELFQTFDHEAKVASGKHKVLMLPDESVLRKLKESLSADSYSEGSALYSGCLGQKTWSEKLSLSDLRLVPERNGLCPFDYEGTVANAATTPLIEHGVMKALISDIKNEQRYGIQSTANGFRDYNSSIRLNFSHLALEPGKRDFRKILKDAGDVIVCYTSFGGDLTGQGDFASPIQMAFLAKNGQIVGKLPALSMSSNLDKMLGGDLLEVAASGPFGNACDPYLLCEMDIQLM